MNIHVLVCGVLFVSGKAKHYAVSNPRKSRRCAIVSLIGSTTLIVLCGLLIGFGIHHGVHRKTCDTQSREALNCPYCANSVCYSTKDCMTSCVYCLHGYFGYYATEGCCYYNANQTTKKSTTTQICPTVYPVICRYSRLDGDGPCYTFKTCWLSSSSCLLHLHGYYADDQCCYHNY